MYYNKSLKKEDLDHFYEDNPNLLEMVKKAVYWDDRLFKVYLTNNKILYYDSYERHCYEVVRTDEPVTAEKSKWIFSRLLDWALMRTFTPQYKIADDLGINRITLYKYTHEKALPNIQVFRKLAKYLKIDPYAFFDAMDE